MIDAPGVIGTLWQQAISDKAAASAAAKVFEEAKTAASEATSAASKSWAALMEVIRGKNFNY